MNDTVMPTRHIGADRLFQVATTQTQHFDATELEHLRSCGACSDHFADIVFESIHELDAAETDKTYAQASD